jgi:hypothetical protein
MFEMIEISMVAALYIYIICFLLGLLFMSILYFNLAHKNQGYFYFLLFFAFASVGALMTALRPILGEFISIIVANGLLVTGYVMISIGVRKTLSIRLNTIGYITSSSIFFILMIIGTYVINSITYRVFFLNGMIAFTLIDTLVALYRAKKLDKELK